MTSLSLRLIARTMRAARYFTSNSDSSHGILVVTRRVMIIAIKLGTSRNWIELEIELMTLNLVIHLIKIGKVYTVRNLSARHEQQ